MPNVLVLPTSPLCAQCKTFHGDIRAQVKAGTACPRCRGPRHTHTLNPCKSTRAAHFMCKRGLISTRRWRNNGTAWLVTPARHAATTLKMFGIKHWMVRSNHISGGEPALECWTTQEGIETLAAIQHTARVIIGGTISNPMVARLFRDNPTVFDEFKVLWKLDAPEATLRHELLEALNPLTKPRGSKPDLHALRGRVRRIRGRARKTK